LKKEKKEPRANRSFFLGPDAKLWLIWIMSLGTFYMDSVFVFSTRSPMQSSCLIWFSLFHFVLIGWNFKNA
jgi:hypothetical protein